ncbi:MAG: hypothetical protein PF569_05130, partial [Candidatus Woesearchaeota archaeon]|nr:hypothetical protein [Candidatus Woesearchaeota archaeon]
DLDKELKGEVFALESKIKTKDDLFFGQIDNVISVAVLYYILKNFDFKQEIIFTTGEEIGVSYQNVLEYMKDKKEILDIITLDTSPYENFNNKKVGFLTLRKGDENGKFNIELVNQIEKILIENSVSINFKSSKKGITELGRMSSESNGKLNGATIQLPTMNYHTTYETSTMKSLENYFKIIKILSE